MFLGLSWSGEGNARKRRDERRREIDVSKTRRSLRAPLLEKGLLRVDVREARRRRLCVGIRLAERKAPFGDALAFDVRLGGEEALPVEHVHEALIIERPHGTTHSLSSLSAMR